LIRGWRDLELGRGGLVAARLDARFFSVWAALRLRNAAEWEPGFLVGRGADMGTRSYECSPEGERYMGYDAFFVESAEVRRCQSE
jgi:hypothetical protein